MPTLLEFIDLMQKAGPTISDVHIETVIQSECTCELITCSVCHPPIIEANIVKLAPEQQIAYAIVYEPERVDSQADFARAREIEKMAHDFMINSQRYDLQHRADVPRDSAYVVESFIAPVDFAWTLPSGAEKVIRKGAWVVATYFKDAQLWQMVKTGQINAYSIYGKGFRVPTDMLVNVL